MRALRTVLASSLMLGLLAGALFALLDVGLPTPGRSDRLGARVLAELDRLGGAGSRGRLDGAPFAASCRRLSAQAGLVHLADGTRLLLSGTRVRLLGRSAVPTRAASVLVSEAELAGSLRLYRIELTNRLLSGAPLLGRLTELRGTPGYTIELASTPSVALIVDRRTLAPAEAVVHAPGASGWARIELAASQSHGC